ncbi:MAG: hypothetical protein JWO25_2870 [Alphaproteobacteria bacterium]|nr:hypothetical protein [Alphaproteobacteria bacterium]MDB5720376.1 hypothetical protein [Alphaproteobacteria bacterium]
MAFKVVWMKGPLVLGNMAFEALSEAVRHAEDQLVEMQANFGITAVKIVDERGTPVYLKATSRS